MGERLLGGHWLYAAVPVVVVIVPVSVASPDSAVLQYPWKNHPSFPNGIYSPEICQPVQKSNRVADCVLVAYRRRGPR